MVGEWLEMITASTSICCIIGDPVEHSLSPLIHNTGYQVLGLNFVYVAFRVKDIKLAIEGIRGLGIRGASVTIPHKINAMKYLDEVDGAAKEMGAINTIINDNGILKGYNSDYMGAIRALEEKVAIRGKRAVLIGAGGVGLAIATGLKHKGAELVILDMVKKSAESLAKQVGAQGFGGMDNLAAIDSADILINATPVGMWPKTDETAVPAKMLHPGLAVFDVVYNPMETRLIAEAKKAGCTVVYGHKMFLYQAVSQFELFTGRKAPVAEMEKVLIKSLKGI
jgi:shikimate dehydrogenase